MRNDFELVRPTTRQLLLALTSGSVAIVPLGIQPILLGALADANQITLDEFGLLAMVEIFALGLGVVLGNALLQARPLRQGIFCAGMVAVVADLMSAHAHQAFDLAVLRGLAGLAEGVLVWAATAMILRSAAPARLAGVFTVQQTLLQAACGALLASLVLPRTGWPGGFWLLAGLAALACLLAWGHPARLAPRREAREAAVVARPSGQGGRIFFFPLLVILGQLACIGAMWSFLDPLGQQVGYDSSGAKNLVALTLVLQVAGGTCATFAVRRLPALPTLLACSAALACIGWGLQHAGSGNLTAFAALSMAMGFVWLFALPFQVQFTLQRDPVGTTAAVAPAAQLLGVAFGPLVASLFVGEADARPAMLVGWLVALTVCLLLAGAMLRRTSGSTP